MWQIVLTAQDKVYVGFAQTITFFKSSLKREKFQQGALLLYVK